MPVHAFRHAFAAACLLSSLVLPAIAGAALPADFTDELVLDNLTQPVDLTVLPSGEILVLERGGNILITDPAANPAVESTYLSVPNVDSSGEKGLLSIALDPDFASNNYFYIYYHNSTVDRARVSRFIHDVDHAHASDEFVIWEDNFLTANQIIADHWGGGFDFGPDGYLYLTVGDKKDFPADSQNLQLTAGKILRFDTAGADSGGGEWIQGSDNPHLVPDDNPYIDGPGGVPDEIWALGLRNPFRAHWDLLTGRFFIGEVGGNIQGGANASHEDIHMVTTADAAANFGWPACEGPSCAGSNPANYSPPIFSVKHPDSQALVVGPVYRGSLFPTAYDNALFFADYARGWLRYLTFDASGNVAANVPTGGFQFAGNGDLGNPVALAIGLDEALYYVDIVGRNANGGGQLRRITYSSGNAPPIITQASADATSSTTAPFVVNFSGAATDPEGQPLSYDWDFGDNTAHGTSANVAHTYTAKGAYSAVLRVSDSIRTATADPIVIEVGSPPVPSIAEPLDGDFFVAGQFIQLRGSGTDADGTLSNDDFRWTVQFKHNEHFHPFITNVPGTPCAPPGSTCLDFTIAGSGHDFADDTGYEIFLDVTDLDGLHGSTAVSIVPDKVDLTFNSTVPGGITYFLDQTPRSGPFVYDTLIGFQHTISVPPSVISGGDQYVFDSWSNGPTTTTQTITVPASNQVFTAFYTNMGPTPRVVEGLLALYEFGEGTGNTVLDVSPLAPPLNLDIAEPGKVSWGLGTLTVNQSTLLSTAGAAGKINNAIKASNALSIEAWVTPANTAQSGPARIVSLSASPALRNATLGQGDSGGAPGTLYSQRLRTTTTSDNGNNPTVTTAAGSLGTTLTHVVYTRDGSGQAKFYIDGNPVTSTPATVGGNLSNWDASYPLLLANEATGDRPWLGTFSLLAIYERALDAGEVAQNFTAGPQDNLAQPSAENDQFSIDEDGVLNGNVLDDNGNGADTDPDLNPLSVSAVNGSAANVNTTLTLSSGATVLVDASGNLVYDPNGQFESLAFGEQGSDTLFYTVANGVGGSDTATVSIDVSGVNDAPAIAGVADASVIEGDTLDVALAATDAELDGLTFSLDGPAPAFVSITNNPATLRIAPLVGDNGVYSFDVVVTDDGAPNRDARTSVTVTVIDASTINPPVAMDDAFTTNEDSSLTGNVLADNSYGVDSDPDSDPLTVTAIAVDGDSYSANTPITLPSGAELIVAGDGALSYDPAGQFESLGGGAEVLESFSYTISDGVSGTDTATVTVTVTGLNDAPSLTAIAAQTVNEEDALNVPLSASDAEADSLSFGLGAGTPAFVSLTDNGNGSGTLAITPPPGSAGVYPITVTVTDDGTPAESANTSFNVTVSATPPRVSSGLLALYEFNAGSGTTVLDVSALAPPLDLTIAEPGKVSWGTGTLTVNQSTLLSSAVAAGKINNAIKASNALSIEAWVKPANTTQGGPARIVSLSTSTGSRNATLGQGNSGSPGTLYSQRLRTTTTGNNGSNPTVTTAPGSLGTALTHVVYTRDASGQAKFYIDGNPVTSTPATVGGNLSNWDAAYKLLLANEASGDRPWLGTFSLVAIYGRALAAGEVAQNFTAGPRDVLVQPSAENDQFSIDEDGVLNGNVLDDNGNGADTDPDLNPLSVSAVNGSAANVNTTLTLASGATVLVDASGNLVYDPNGQFESLAFGEQGSDTLFYTVANGVGGSDTATVSIDVSGVNDAPAIAGVADASVIEGDTLDVALAATDAELDGLTFSLDGPAPAFVSITNNPATLRIAPLVGDNGVYSFDVVVTDDGAPNRDARTSVTVTVIDASTINPPVAMDDAFTTNEDSSLTGNVLADNSYGVDSDPDSDPLTVTAVAVDGDSYSANTPITLPSGAELIVAGDGALSYDPAGQFESLGGGAEVLESFSYTISDGVSGTDTATVTVTVTGLNDAPSLTAIAAQTVNEEDALNVPLSASDAEADSLSFGLGAGTPAFVSLTDNGNGSGTLAITPPPGSAGVYPITVTVTDDGTPAESANTSFNVTVSATPPRVSSGLLALYEFNAGSGTTVLDVSALAPPLDLTIAEPGKVSWGTGTLTVNQSTLLSSAVAAGKINNAIKASNALSIEAWVKPANTTQGGPARIVSLSTSTGSRNATLGQGNSGSPGTLYSQRLRTTTTGNNGSNPTVTTAPGSLGTALTHVVYTRDASGQAKFYIDGNPVTSTPATVGGNLSNWDAAYKLLLANEASGDRPWLGTFSLVAIYGRALAAGEVAQNFTAGPRDVLVQPSAENDQFSIDEDGVLNGNVLDDNGNGADTDPDLNPLSVSAVNGSAANVNTTLTLASGATVLVDASGNLVYDPNGQFESLAFGEQGSDTLFYTVANGVGGSDTATVSIDVSGVNDAPAIAGVADASVIEGDTLDVALAATDAELDGLTFSLDGPAPAFVSITNNPATLRIAPLVGDNGVYSFDVVVTDDGAPNRDARTSVTVTVIDASTINPPVAMDDAFTTNEDSSLTGNVLADNSYGVDSDPDSDPLTVTAVAVDGDSYSANTPITLPSGAELIVAGDGALSYDPAGQFESLGGGAEVLESFSYTISDGVSGTDTATVTVTVTGLNDAPSLTAIAAQTVNEEDALNVPLSASDAEADSLSFGLGAGTPAFVSLTDNGNGSGTLAITPPPGSAGVYPITVTVTDDGTPAESANTSFNVTVSATSPRVSSGLLALYGFNAGSGNTVLDVSTLAPPLNLTIADPAKVSWGTGTLTVNQSTLLSSAVAAGKINNAIKASNALTIEAWVKPANTTQSGPARIVSLSASPTLRNATLGQGASGTPGTLYSQRLRTTTTGGNGNNPVVKTATGSLSTALTHVVYTRAANGAVKMYINGAAVPTSTATIGGNLSNWNTAFKLILANEATGNRPWLGTFDLVAVYGRALSTTEVMQNFVAGPL